MPQLRCNAIRCTVFLSTFYAERKTRACKPARASARSPAGTTGQHQHRSTRNHIDPKTSVRDHSNARQRTTGDIKGQTQRLLSFAALRVGINPMSYEDEHQKPIHKLYYLITGTCNCGVRVRVPPPPPPTGGFFCQPCKPASSSSSASHVLNSRTKPARAAAATATPRTPARLLAALGVAALAVGFSWHPTYAAAASVLLVAASFVVT